MWWAASAFALPPPTYVGEFVAPSREDAPGDAVLLVDANVTPGGIVIEGPDAGSELDMAYAVGRLVAVLPPSGGWTAGAPYTVGVRDPSGIGVATELTFSAVDAAAADPVAPEVGAATASPWSDTEWVVRDVTVEVDNLDPDPWSVVLARYEVPSYGEVSVAEIGPGAHVLSFVQLRGELDPCVEIVGVAADGDLSDAVPVCLPDEADDSRPVGTPACGCGGGPPTVGWVSGLIALGIRRRRTMCG